MSITRNPNGEQEREREEGGSDSQAVVLQEGLDYYLENGLMVLTAVFLGRRGYCCERGCRHCPYGHLGNPDQDR